MSLFKEYFKENLSKIVFEEEQHSSDLTIELGKLIKVARKRKKISQIRLSALSGISQSNISKIESGKYNMSIKQLERLLIALNIKLKLEVIDL